jgi:hypothetical protein
MQRKHQRERVPGAPVLVAWCGVPIKKRPSSARKQFPQNQDRGCRCEILLIARSFAKDTAVSRERDRRFESISLQRRVSCELDPIGTSRPTGTQRAGEFFGNFAACRCRRGDENARCGGSSISTSWRANRARHQGGTASSNPACSSAESAANRGSGRRHLILGRRPRCDQAVAPRRAVASPRPSAPAHHRAPGIRRRGSDERGAVGIRLRPAAAIVRQYGEQFRRPARQKR